MQRAKNINDLPLVSLEKHMTLKPPRIRILSIDWDFFIDASEETRNFCFPEGSTLLTSELVNALIWRDKYTSHKELIDIPVTEDFQKMLSFLKECDGLIECMIEEDHSLMYNFVKGIVSAQDSFEVVNIDFHHDLYPNLRLNPQAVHCGNWARALLDEFPQMRYTWVKRSDSDTAPPLYTVDDGMQRRVRTVNAGINFYGATPPPSTFDYLFICRSDPWSPPHLDPFFDKMIRCVPVDSGVVDMSVFRERRSSIYE